VAFEEFDLVRTIGLSSFIAAGAGCEDNYEFPIVFFVDPYPVSRSLKAFGAGESELDLAIVTPRGGNVVGEALLGQEPLRVGGDACSEVRL
jgi:hypothetical protein